MQSVDFNMTWVNISRLAFHSLIGMAALPILQSTAQAIVINDAVGIETARSLGAPFTAVTEVLLGGRLRCSGSLINPNYVLTARHCTSGLDSIDFSVSFRDRDPLNSFLEEISVTSIFEVDGDDSFFDGTDIAILELSAPAPESIEPLRFLTDTETLVGSTVTTVGFGLNGVGSEGHQFTRDSRRWAAENILDWIGGAPFPDGTFIPGSVNIFSTDFDDGTATNNTLAEFDSSPVALFNEGTTASGDSGSPLLIKHDNEFLIAGVLTGGTTLNSVFGDISWWTGTEKYRGFIEKRGGQFVDVPEPSSSFVLMALGAVGAGAMRTRRQQRDRNTDLS